jgi:K+-sensing histidine kinase KdpD
VDPVIDADRTPAVPAGEEPSQEGDCADLQAFLLRLVHDLRSPLNASLMWLDVLRLREQPAETRKAVEAIRRGIDRQIGLLRELGDAAAFAAGPLEISVQRVSVDALTQQIAAAAAEHCDDCRIETAAGAADAHVDVDLNAIVRAVGSIIARFAAVPSGHVRVDVQAPDFARRLHIAISRNDASIEAEMLRALVQPPWRRPDKAYEAKGLDLGIFIAERLITAHGGSLHIIDGPPGEAAVRVELPLAN